jgi:hypothetical protein
VSSSGIKAKAGATLTLRLNLDAADKSGSLSFTGQATSYEDVIVSSDEDSDDEPRSLDEILALLKSQPRQDDVASPPCRQFFGSCVRICQSDSYISARKLGPRFDQA